MQIHAASGARLPLIIALITAMFATLGASFSHALQPINNIADAPISGNPSMKDLTAAMKRAAARRKWAVKEVGTGHFQLLQISRGLTAKVELRFDRDSFSINYLSSENLKYQDKNGGVIHKRYNGWVRNLKADIEKELFAL